jgi:hypothetical protein
LACLLICQKLNATRSNDTPTEMARMTQRPATCIEGAPRERQVVSPMCRQQGKGQARWHCCSARWLNYLAAVHHVAYALKGCGCNRTWLKAMAVVSAVLPPPEIAAVSEQVAFRPNFMNAVSS